MQLSKEVQPKLSEKAPHVAKKEYKWKRFWCRRDESHVVDSDQGYLNDPETDFGYATNPNAKSYSQISDRNCLILLGEPGIGKTTAIQQAFVTEGSAIKANGGLAERVNFNEFGQEDRLEKALFESEAIHDWQAGKEPLYLYLDALDEALLRVDRITEILKAKLPNLPLDRLWLRMSCRTADWPTDLEDNLGQMWPDIGIFELLPLRRTDVEEAARVETVEPETFLNAIDNRDITPLAAKPITLGLLLSLFKNDGSLPTSKVALYRQGILWLAQENNPSRRDAKLAANLPVDKRFAVASRIAALTTLCNKSAIWTGLDSLDLTSSDITTSELTWGSEQLDGKTFDVEQSHIDEVLNTGLFNSRGENRLGWAHQTYAEFLAADYLTRCSISEENLFDLIFHQEDPYQRLVPQLRETAAWLASMAPKVCDVLLESEPEVLLRSDVTKNNANLIPALLERIFEQIRSNELRPREVGDLHVLERLNHPELSNQLEPLIENKTEDLDVRDLAIDIVRCCRQNRLYGLLTEIALDPSENYQIRENASFTVSNYADDKLKAAMRPLAVAQAEEDPNDALRGNGLRAVWPDHLEVNELFELITPPKREHYFGSYRDFLKNHLCIHLKVPDLPLALAWVAEQTWPERAMALREVASQIMNLAFNHLDENEILDCFARAAVARLSVDDPVLDDGIREDNDLALRNSTDKRRTLLKGALKYVEDPDGDIPRKMSYGSAMVLGSDVPWMIEILPSLNEGRERKIVSRLIEHVLDPWNPVHLDLVAEAAETFSELKDSLAGYLKAVDLESERASIMRDHHEWSMNREKADSSPPPSGPSPEQRILSLLNVTESSDIERWWHITFVMTFDPDSEYDSTVHDLDPDLTNLYGWRAADENVRKRLIETAKKFVLRVTPDPGKWLGTDTYNRRDAAGYKAFRLLANKCPDFLDGLEVTVWATWAPVILACLIDSGTGEYGDDYRLVARAYAKAPNEFQDTLRKLIRAEDEAGGRLYITRKLQFCWDNTLAETLLQIVKENTLGPEATGCLLGDLLEFGYAPAEALAAHLVGEKPTERDRAIAKEAAARLLLFCSSTSWQTVHAVLQEDLDFGKDLMLYVTYDFRHRSSEIYESLDPGTMAALYCWLAHNFPHREDPKHDSGGAYNVGPRDQVVYFRDEILGTLRDSGTYEACVAIESIVGQFPQLDWLAITLRDARQKTRANTWQPATPKEFLRLVADSNSRFVQSEARLLDVVVESLDRYQQSLYGETEAWRDLWDRVDSKTDRWRPINEKEFTNHIKRHLEELNVRGIIVNREVEIKRISRADLRIDAISETEKGSEVKVLSVNIEVKGCWNPRLKKAMKEQLVGKYLGKAATSHGLYLVAWFRCGRWDPLDSRSKMYKTLTFEQAVDMFHDQADEVSTEGVTVGAKVINARIP